MNRRKTKVTHVSNGVSERMRIVSLVVLGSVLTLLAVGCGNGAEPAAPGAAVPRRAAAEPALTPADVGGLPVYPGLRRISSAASQQMTINDEVIDTLPVVVAFSDDPAERVKAFYAERLPDRNVTDLHGIRYFWEGDPDEGFNPLDMRTRVARPQISVMPPQQPGRPVRVEYIFEE